MSDFPTDCRHSARYPGAMSAHQTRDTNQQKCELATCLARDIANVHIVRQNFSLLRAIKLFSTTSYFMAEFVHDALRRSFSLARARTLT